MAHPDELNPDNPVTNAVSGQWHTVCAWLMVKFKRDKVRFRARDFRNIKEKTDAGGINIGISDGIDPNSGEKFVELRLVGDEEAKRLASKHGGTRN